LIQAIVCESLQDKSDILGQRLIIQDEFLVKFIVEIVQEKAEFKNKLISIGKNLAIQAEALGPKLNGNSLGLKDLEMKVFRIKNLDTKQILGLIDLQYLCNQLNLPMVNVIEVCIFNKNIHTVEYFRELADKQVWRTNGKPGEGIVICPTQPFYSSILQKSWSCKLTNQNYK